MAETDWLSVGASLLGGLLGSDSGDKSATTKQSMDPRMDRYVYGQDGQSGLLGGAWGMMQKQAANGGLNDLQRQGLEMQRQYLMSPQYQNGYANMASMGQSLMGGGVAGNPFTQQPPGGGAAIEPWLQTPGGGYPDGMGRGGPAVFPGYPRPPQGGGNISAPPVNGSVDDKANWYKQQRAGGMTDARIRGYVDQTVGKQSDEDWSYLQLKSAAGGSVADQARWYSEQRASGMSDDQIRGYVDQMVGKLADADWSYLQSQAANSPARNKGAFWYDTSKMPNGNMNAGIPNYASTPTLARAPAHSAGGFGGSGGYGDGGSGGYGGGSSGNGGGFSIGVGQMTDAINSNALSAAKSALAFGLAPAALAGLYSQYTASHGFMDSINQAADPLGALAAAQGWTGIDPGYNAWSGNYGGGATDSDSDGGWGGGYGFGGGTSGMGD